MALGTITVTNDERKGATAPLGLLELSFPGDSLYPTGGTLEFESLVQAAVGREVDVLCVVKAGACGVYTPIYDKANDTLYVEDAAGAEVTDETVLTTTVFKVIVFYQ